MSHLYNFLVSNLASAIAGVFLGYHLAVIIAHRREAKMSGDDKPNHQVRTGIAILIGSMALIGVGATFAYNQYTSSVEADETAQQLAKQGREFKACVNNYTTLQAAAQDARAKASAELDEARQAVFDANTDLWALIADSFASGEPVSKKAGETALGAYLSAANHEQKVLEHLQSARARHPYPEPPEVACE